MGTESINLIVQGDVFLVPCKVPDNAKLLGHKTLAEGEATGHHHTATGGKLYELDKVLYFSTDKPVEIKHQEHKPITIPIGDFKVGIVREWDEFEQEAKNVRD